MSARKADQTRIDQKGALGISPPYWPATAVRDEGVRFGESYIAPQPLDVRTRKIKQTVWRTSRFRNFDFAGALIPSPRSL